MKARENETGFTLVEIMVAMAFFSLVIVGVAQAIITGQQHSQIIEENALILARCEDIMYQMESMSITDIAGENGTTFSVGGVPGTGTVSVTNPYLGSDDIAHVVLRWDNLVILERAFGEAAAIPLGQ
jgi:type II secretory pathway pseudopilin PulG